jgi:hypothetical protein
VTRDPATPGACSPRGAVAHVATPAPPVATSRRGGRPSAGPRLLDAAALPGRLAVGPAEAAAALGVGLTFFAESIAPDLRIVRRGRRILVPVSELVRWLERNGEAVAETIGTQR